MHRWNEEFGGHSDDKKNEIFIQKPQISLIYEQLLSKLYLCWVVEDSIPQFVSIELIKEDKQLKWLFSFSGRLENLVWSDL
jgi:hypothetical protein